ncbi:MAG: galactose-1-phosphate uridylyltransferase [Helicobacteraceae bacterium]
MNEFRKNALKNEWVLIAPNHLRNFSFKKGASVPSGIQNPFLPGNEALTPPEIFRQPSSGPWINRVFANKFSLMSLEAKASTNEIFGDETLGSFGVHEMIIDSPDPAKHFFEFSEQEHRLLLETLKIRTASLSKDARIKSVFAYKEQGALSGGLIPHSNTQLTGFGFVYGELEKEIANSRRYFLEKNRSIFKDLIKQARQNGLIVEENSAFAAFVPFSAKHEFEIWIVPTAPLSVFYAADKYTLDNLAKITAEVCKKLSITLTNIDLNWALISHFRSYEHNEKDFFYKIDEHFRWRIEITPRLKPIGAITTQAGFYINTVDPQEAAKYLRNV